MSFPRGPGPDVYEIPEDRLPQGFRDTLAAPPDPPVAPRPAATVVLMRDRGGPPEVLLLKRNRATGFVPGAYVFPGGRVDTADGGDAISRRWQGLDEARARERLAMPGESEPPAIAYFTAAVREAFEETGLLVSTGTAPAAPDDALGPERDDLLEGRASFSELLERWSATLDGTRIEYIAHWVTPLVEPRRYDTRFFAALVAPDARATIDAREMTAAEWLTPGDALDRHRAGTLPMIFPTIRTLEDLSPFDSAEALFAHYRTQRIPMLMPEIVRTSSGVALRLPGP